MMDKDCLSCKEIHALLYIRDGQNMYRSNQLDLADEMGGRIVCKNKHIVYNGLDIK